MKEIRKIIKETIQRLFEEVDEDTLSRMRDFGIDEGDIDENGYVTLYHGGIELPERLNTDEIFFMTPDYATAENYVEIRSMQKEVPGEVFVIKVRPEDVSWNTGSGEVEFDRGGLIRMRNGFYTIIPRTEENIDVPINVGDTVLGGRFKNKKIVVKDIDKNEKGDITINDKPLLKVRTLKEEDKIYPPDANVGKEFWFEYHCFESSASCDAEVWYHSHQKVKVLFVSTEGNGNTPQERGENGEPRVYRVKFEDGLEWDVFEDELMNSPKEFYRPDPPALKENKSNTTKLTCLYIHGLGAPMSDDIKQSLSAYNLIYPTINYDDSNKPYYECLNTLKENKVDFIIGHSIGGVEAFYLAKETNVPALLLCPAFEDEYKVYTSKSIKRYSPKIMAIIGEKDDEVNNEKVKAILQAQSNCFIKELNIGHDISPKNLSILSKIFVKKL